MTEATVRRMMDKYGIPRRSNSDAHLNYYRRTSGGQSIEETSRSTLESIEELLSSLQAVTPVNYDPPSRENLSIPIPLKCLEKNRKLDATVTLVLSDLHLGHENFLPDTFWSTISNLCRMLEAIQRFYNVKRANLVLNGDIVSGIGVYRGQEFENIVPRGHWQVFLAEVLLRKLLGKIEKHVKIHRMYLIKGTHETRENNYMLYLRKIFHPLSVYSSKSLILNIAEPIGKYNILFTHGRGRSSYYPVSYEQVRNIWKAVRQLDVPVEKVCVGHSHWLTPELDLEGVSVCVTGGFQKWEYTVPQRPCGMLLILYSEGEASIVPVRPNPDIEAREKNEPALEYKNMRYYAELLAEHMKNEPAN